MTAEELDDLKKALDKAIAAIEETTNAAHELARQLLDISAGDLPPSRLKAIEDIFNFTDQGRSRATHGVFALKTARRHVGYLQERVKPLAR